MLTCYLDDSGKDPQNPITTVAGYLARDDAWQAFETEVEPIFAEKKVSVLHARDLHAGDSDFKGWIVLQKHAFVAQIMNVAAPRVMIGVSMSAHKDNYREHAGYRASGDEPRRTVTPYTFCFQVIVDWLLRDIRVGRAVHSEGLALVLECGHENNSQAEQEFYVVRKKYGLENVLRSISFVPKELCRAIQLADLLAFYSRRDGVAYLRAIEKNDETFTSDTIVKIITERVLHRAFVATGFHDRPPS